MDMYRKSLERDIWMVKRRTFQRAISCFFLPPACRLLPFFFTPSPVSLLSPPSLPPRVSFFSPCLLSRSSFASRGVRGDTQMERPRLFRTLISAVRCKSTDSKDEEEKRSRKDHEEEESPEKRAVRKDLVPFPVAQTEEEWRRLLTPDQFKVLRLKGTEPPGTGVYNKFYPKKGYFACAACGAALYPASAKFDSGCGWPAFDRFFKGSITTIEDRSLGMIRTEIVCSNCGGHLGHAFHGEGYTETNERHCVNSVSVVYREEEKNVPLSRQVTLQSEKSRELPEHLKSFDSSQRR